MSLANVFNILHLFSLLSAIPVSSRFFLFLSNPLFLLIIRLNFLKFPFVTFLKPVLFSCSYLNCFSCFLVSVQLICNLFSWLNNFTITYFSLEVTSLSRPMKIFIYLELKNKPKKLYYYIHFLLCNEQPLSCIIKSHITK